MHICFQLNFCRRKKESVDSDMIEYFMEFGGMHFVCSLKESITTFTYSGEKNRNCFAGMVATGYDDK